MTLAARIIAIVTILFFTIAGFYGFLLGLGLVLLVLAVQLLATRRARWAFLPGPKSRSLGLLVGVAALLALIFGVSVTPPQPRLAAAPTPTVTETVTPSPVTKTVTPTTAPATVTETPTPSTTTVTAPPVTVTAPAAQMAPPSPPAPRISTATPTRASTTYANCTEVRAAGAAPIRPGDPGWDPKFDRDGDGQGCGND